MDFQIKLSTLLLTRGFNNHYEFDLEKELAETGKFEVTISTFSNGSGEKETIISQAKHADSSIKKIGIDLLFISNLNKSCFFYVFGKILKTLTLIFSAAKSIGVDLQLSFFINIVFNNSGVSPNSVIMVERTSLRKILPYC